MAAVHIAIGYSKGRGVGGAQLPVRSSQAPRSEAFTSSSSSQATSLTATQAEIDQGALWFVTSTGGAIDVTSGTSPTATNANSHRVTDGATMELAISVVGEKLAFKDAA